MFTLTFQGHLFLETHSFAMFTITFQGHLLLETRRLPRLQ